MKNDTEQQFKTLLTQHEATIGYVCRLYSRGDSYHYAALYQEVALSLWRELASHGLGRLQRSDKVAAWVYRIAVNAGINYCHSSAGRQVAEPLAPADADSLLPSVEESPDECWDELVAALADDERRLLQLLLQGYSYDEIAQREGLSATAVGSRLWRIRRKLKEEHKLN